MPLPSFPVLSENPEYPMITEFAWHTSVVHYGGKAEQRRSNIIRDRRRFIFRYRLMALEDKNLLLNFFNEILNRRFNWLNPEDRLVYIVRFDITQLNLPYVSFGYWDTDWVRLIEVI